jgi:hypothetical protein
VEPLGVNPALFLSLAEFGVFRRISLIALSPSTGIRAILPYSAVGY